MVKQKVTNTSQFCRIDSVPGKVGLHLVTFYFYFVFNLLIYLTAWGLSYSTWDLVPWPGSEPRPPALEAQSLSHWTTREVPLGDFLKIFIYLFYFTTLYWFCHTLTWLRHGYTWGGRWERGSGWGTHVYSVTFTIPYFICFLIIYIKEVYF